MGYYSDEYGSVSCKSCFSQWPMYSPVFGADSCSGVYIGNSPTLIWAFVAPMVFLPSLAYFLWLTLVIVDAAQPGNNIFENEQKLLRFAVHTIVPFISNVMFLSYGTSAVFISTANFTFFCFLLFFPGMYYIDMVFFKRKLKPWYWSFLRFHDNFIWLRATPDGDPAVYRKEIGRAKSIGIMPKVDSMAALFVYLIQWIVVIMFQGFTLAYELFRLGILFLFWLPVDFTGLLFYRTRLMSRTFFWEKWSLLYSLKNWKANVRKYARSECPYQGNSDPGPDPNATDCYLAAIVEHKLDNLYYDVFVQKRKLSDEDLQKLKNNLIEAAESLKSRLKVKGKSSNESNRQQFLEVTEKSLTKFIEAIRGLGSALDKPAWEKIKKLYEDALRCELVCLCKRWTLSYPVETEIKEIKELSEPSKKSVKVEVIAPNDGYFSAKEESCILFGQRMQQRYIPHFWNIAQCVNCDGATVGHPKSYISWEQDIEKVEMGEGDNSKVPKRGEFNRCAYVPSYSCDFVMYHKSMIDDIPTCIGQIIMIYNNVTLTDAEYSSFEKASIAFIIINLVFSIYRLMECLTWWCYNEDGISSKLHQAPFNYFADMMGKNDVFLYFSILPADRTFTMSTEVSFYEKSQEYHDEDSLKRQLLYMTTRETEDKNENEIESNDLIFLESLNCIVNSYYSVITMLVKGYADERDTKGISSSNTKDSDSTLKDDRDGETAFLTVAQQLREITMFDNRYHGSIEDLLLLKIFLLTDRQIGNIGNLEITIDDVNAFLKESEAELYYVPFDDYKNEDDPDDDDYLNDRVDFGVYGCIFNFLAHIWNIFVCYLVVKSEKEQNKKIWDLLHTLFRYLIVQQTNKREIYAIEFITEELEVRIICPIYIFYSFITCIKHNFNDCFFSRYY